MVAAQHLTRIFQAAVNNRYAVYNEHSTSSPTETPVASPTETPVALPAETQVASPVETSVESTENSAVNNDNESVNLTPDEKKLQVASLISTKRTDFTANSEFIDDLVSKYDLYKTCHPNWDEDMIAERLNLYLKALEAHKKQLKYGEIAQMPAAQANDAVTEMSENVINDSDIEKEMSNKNTDGTVAVTDDYMNALVNRGVGYLDLYDTNGDEKISKAEFLALEAKDSGREFTKDKKKFTKKYFKMMDKNGDNQLDAKEMASHLFAVSRLYDAEEGAPKNSVNDITYMEWYGAQDPQLSDRLSQASDILYNAIKDEK